jgi:TolB-like protein
MFRDRDPCRASGRWRAALLFVVLISAAIGFPLRAGAQAETPKLLLLPFVVHSAEDPEYVRGGLADMLSARFSRIGGIDLIREDDPEKGTSKLEEALLEAREVGADYVLFGSFTRFGQGASLDVQCAPVATGQAQEPLREIFVHSGSIGEIIPDLDELAGKVSRFARGEVIEGPTRAASSLGVSADELEDLARRVAELEALVDDLRASDLPDSPDLPDGIEDLEAFEELDVIEDL